MKNKSEADRKNTNCGSWGALERSWGSAIRVLFCPTFWGLLEALRAILGRSLVLSGFLDAVLPTLELFLGLLGVLLGVLDAT